MLQMTSNRFPDLQDESVPSTRDALHAYSKVLGNWLKTVRRPRKHWWHASLRPTARGVSTGPVYADIDFELELDFYASELWIRSSAGQMRTTLHGQSAAELALWLDQTLAGAGQSTLLPEDHKSRRDKTFAAYSAATAATLQQALASVAATLERLRAAISEETSPIQLWPHHFDLSMIWLPGKKVPDQDSPNEEFADKQMNFGFLFGDDTFAEPYFYITAYPLPDELARLSLPAPATWKSDNFSGAVLLYRDLVQQDNPASYLYSLWTTLLLGGKRYLANDD